MKRVIKFEVDVFIDFEKGPSEEAIVKAAKDCVGLNQVLCGGSINYRAKARSIKRVKR